MTWIILLVVLVAAVWVALRMTTRFPGRSLRGPLPAATPTERGTARALRRHVDKLAGEIGERNIWTPGALQAATEYVKTELAESGYAVTETAFDCEGVAVSNIEVALPGDGRPEEIVVIGAHLDTVRHCPGANDNGSGVAALLVLARRFAGARPPRTIRFVVFANEENPFSRTEGSGSVRYARRSAAGRERVAAMITVETIGYYRDRAGSQRYPFPLTRLYPDRGDFLAFVGNLSSRRLVARAVASFRKHGRLPSEGGALPGWLPGIGWSDHWSFWQEGYPGIMVTDTAPFRYPAYHRPEDTPDRIDYDRTARATEGLATVVADLAGLDGVPAGSAAEGETKP
jgi:Zn-dependent M28 family amino/carboxypeptidase